MKEDTHRRPGREEFCSCMTGDRIVRSWPCCLSGGGWAGAVPVGADKLHPYTAPARNGPELHLYGQHPDVYKKICLTFFCKRHNRRINSLTSSPSIMICQIIVPPIIPLNFPGNGRTRTCLVQDQRATL